MRALLTAAASLSVESAYQLDPLPHAQQTRDSTTVLPNIDVHHSVTFTSMRDNARLGRRQSEN